MANGPQVPSLFNETFYPDQLIAGPFPRVSDTVTITGGVKLDRGSLLGKVTSSGSYVLSTTTASDGSQIPSAILIEDCDVTGGDLPAGVYLSGEFNAGAVTLGTGWTLAAANAALRDVDIYLKSVMTAADPT